MISSAINPGPKISAARACTHTAQFAARKDSMRCANKPATIPVNTSPDPAVASQGVAQGRIEARPSGAAACSTRPGAASDNPSARSRTADAPRLRPLLRLQLPAPRALVLPDLPLPRRPTHRVARQRWPGSQIGRAHV